MSLPQILIEGFAKLPVLTNASICSGKTYIVTGGNSGLGLETARHFVRCSAARVIITVRSMEAGENAKKDIEHSTGRKGVIEVWYLDLASFVSVKAFVEKATSELDRIDTLIENAGVQLDRWEETEGMEMSMNVNVTSTMLLGLLMLPKLQETARRFETETKLVFVTSALGFVAEKELRKSGDVGIFKSLNDPKCADMGQRYSLSFIFTLISKANFTTRYALTKLVQMYAIREFATSYPVDQTGVVVNMIAPGLCSTGLGRDTSTTTRAIVGGLRAIFARTAEEGSRTILHGVVAGKESHGKLLSGCKIKEYV